MGKTRSEEFAVSPAKRGTAAAGSWCLSTGLSAEGAGTFCKQTTVPGVHCMNEHIQAILKKESLLKNKVLQHTVCLFQPAS